MKFIILNGSPKGNHSITLQTIKYLEKRFVGHDFEIINVGSSIKSIEKDPTKVVKSIQESEIVLFVYPVYTFLAPSQLHRIIHLFHKEGISFDGKFVSQITTSKHFYDITAHKYIEENAMDLKMKYIKGLSLDMEDLTKDEGREHIDAYFKFLLYSIENNLYELPREKEEIKDIEYVSTNHSLSEKDNSKDIVIVKETDEDVSLNNLILDFQSSIKYNTRVVNLGDFHFQGGCLGCLKCALHGKCVYTDGFHEMLIDIQKADSIIYAFRIVDHSMGPIFKTYDDRQFENGHRTLTEGKPTGYLVIGDIQNEQNLKTVLEARADTGKNYLTGIANEKNSLDMLTMKLEYALENKLEFPRTFYGVGGLKIFRDLIWGMRGIMKDDYAFYKKHHMFDFPQKKRGTMILMCLVGKLMRNKKMMKKMGKKMDEGMLKSYTKVIENTKPIE